MENLYNEDYFERGIELNISGYSNYRWIPELTIPLAFNIIEFLDIKKHHTILDYGCAKGYLVNAFRLLNRDAYGYDVSEYALQNCHSDVREYLSNNLYNKVFDFIVCKDVLEHIQYNMLLDILKNMYFLGNKFFIIVPLGENGKYVIPSYDFDVTHVIKESIEWWANKFIDVGFKIDYQEYSASNIKQNYSKWKNGNAFFVLSKES